MASKYIIVKDHSLELPIVFSDMLQHIDVAGRMMVVSAGFCYVDDSNEWKCYGRSGSLQSYSREDVDSEILNEFIPV